MSMKETIEKKLVDSFSPVHLSVEDESHGHNVPAGAESHFKVVMVSDKFDSLMAVKRHQGVYSILSEEMSGSVHALALHLYTKNEWKDKGGSAPVSPNCLGGDKPTD